MKSFFEEYGFVILAAIVLILLIAMASPIGDLVKAQITGIVDSFANKTESKLNAVDAGAITVRANSVNGYVKLEWTPEKKEDQFYVKYRASTTASETDWKVLTSGTLENGKIKTKNTFAADATASVITSAIITQDTANKDLENGTKVEYKVYNSNNEVVASGTVVTRK